MDSFRAIIELWPSLPEFASDVDVIYVTAQAMHRRDGIDACYWPAMIEAAARRSIRGVTLERLAAIAASRRTSIRQSHQSSESPSPPATREARAA
jgi:hypothetical protein